MLFLEWELLRATQSREATNTSYLRDKVAKLEKKAMKVKMNLGKGLKHYRRNISELSLN